MSYFKLANDHEPEVVYDLHQAIAIAERFMSQEIPIATAEQAAESDVAGFISPSGTIYNEDALYDGGGGWNTGPHEELQRSVIQVIQDELGLPAWPVGSLAELGFVEFVVQRQKAMAVRFQRKLTSNQRRVINQILRLGAFPNGLHWAMVDKTDRELRQGWTRSVAEV